MRSFWDCARAVAVCVAGLWRSLLGWHVSMRWSCEEAAAYQNAIQIARMMRGTTAIPIHRSSTCHFLWQSTWIWHRLINLYPQRKATRRKQKSDAARTCAVVESMVLSGSLFPIWWNWRKWMLIWNADLLCAYASWRAWMWMTKTRVRM